MFSNFNEHKADRKKFWPTWLSVAGGIGAMFLFELVIALIIGFAMAMFVLSSGAPVDESQLEVPMVLDLFLTISAVLATAWVCRLHKWKNADVGVVLNKKTIKEYFIGALIGFIMLAISILPAFIAGQATFSLSALSPALWGMWALYGVGFVIQSFSEEYLCRGFIMKRLSQRYNIWWTLFLQAAIFMLMHSGNPGLGIVPYLNLFLIGVIFGQVVILTDNLMLASGLHWLWNFAQGCIFGIKVSGLEGMTTILECEMNGHHLLTGADFGIEGALSTSIVSLIVIAAITPKMLKIIKEKSQLVEVAQPQSENIVEEENK